MKSKAPLPLMEQLLMVLVFALTAALCLQGFTLADHLSHRQGDRSWAVVQVQNAAELLQHSGGDHMQTAEQTGAVWNGQCWTVFYDDARQPLPSAEHAAYQLQIWPQETDLALFGSAHICMFRQEDLLFEVTVGWQEVDAHE